MTSRPVALVAIIITALFVASGCREDPQAARVRLVASGDKFYAAKNYAEAVIQYRNAVAKDGSSGEARFKLGRAFVETGDYRNALREFVRAADLMPQNYDAQLAAGQGLLLARSYPEAKARAVAALALKPKSIEALTLMGNALAGLKDIDGAISQIEEAIESDPHRTMTYANLGALEVAKGNRTAAEGAFKRAVEVDPKSESAHLALANFYWALNQLADAERELKLAFEIAPKSPSATRALAQLYISTNRSNEAEKFLKAYADLVTEAGPKIVLADFYLGLGRQKDAEAVLEPLLKTQDGFIAAKLRYARIETNAGRRPQAYQAIEDALKRDKKSETARLEKVRMLLADGKVAEAGAIVKQVVADNPQSVTGHYLRGSALSALGEREEAIKAFQDVLKLSPTVTPALTKIAMLYLAQGNPTAAVDVLDQALKLQPKSVFIHFLLAKSLLLQGNVAGAEKDVMTLARLGVNSSDAQALLGDFYWLKKDWGHSREAYTRALQLQSSSIDALKGLIRLDLAQNAPEAARARIESRLAANPNDPTLLLLAGQVFAQTGASERAETTYQHLLQVDASNMSAYNELGALYMVQNRLDDARRQYSDAAQKEPKSAVATTTMLGVILTLQSKHGEARKQYEKALALDPMAAVAANNLAWDYAENGGANLDLALQLAQTAKARLPNSWEVTDTLGWIYYKKGLAPQAVTAFQQGVEQNPSNPTAQYHLGLAHLKNGDRLKAKNALQRALTLDPRFAAADDAKRVLGTIKG